VIAYKFLQSGRVGPFSGFEWPEPGEWVRAARDPVVCRQGVHACRTSDLPWWLADELWEIELDGDVEAHDHKILAPAGRLRSRVDGWTPACAQDYADACAWRAHGRAIEALSRAGQASTVEELSRCVTLDDAEAMARRLAESIPAARISLTIAGDAVVRARQGAAPTSGYIAAHAALHLDQRAGYDAERAWQSRWLVDRLAL
jgi:hypothetical protein